MRPRIAPVRVSIAALAAITETAYGAICVTSDNTHQDTACGTSALESNTTGVANIAIGYYALFSNSTGSNNSASGSEALFYNTTGSYNTATGATALESNTTGNYNTAVGYAGLSANTTGTGNTATGLDALFSNKIGNNNTANGFESLLYSTSGNYNTAGGSGSLHDNTTGSNNAAYGYLALYSNYDGYDNTASGANALYSNTTGYGNTAAGMYSLYKNSTGESNTGFGYEALDGNSVGNNNVGVGVKSLYQATGSGNTALGFEAGYALTTGSNNIDIGNAGLAEDKGTIRIGAAGTQTAAYVAGIATSRITGAPVYVTASGQLGVLASAERYKTAIAPLGSTTEKLAQLRPVSFHLKSEPAGAVQYGLIAEEVERIYPELVIRDGAGKIQGVRYDELAPLLLKEMQKQQQINAAQNRIIKAQADQLAEVGARVTELMRQMTEVRQLNEATQAALLLQQTNAERVAKR